MAPLLILVLLLSFHVKRVSPSTRYQVLALLPASFSVDHSPTTTLQAMRYAAASINQDTSILPSHFIELTIIGTGGCGRQKDEYRSLIDFIAASNDSVEAIGAAGPFCNQYPQSSDLVSKTITNFNVLHVSGSVLNNPRDSVSLVSITSENVLFSAVFHTLDHFEWHRIGLISGIDQTSLVKLHEINNQGENPVEIVFDYVFSSAISLLQHIQENDATIFLLSMTLNEVYGVICHVYKYQRHLMWPQYAWIVYGHWFEDILHEHRVSPGCNSTEIQHAMEGVILLNLRLEPEDVTDIIISGQTYKKYTTSLFPSGATTSERFRANLAYDSVWALAMALNGTAMSTNTTKLRDMFMHLEFHGATGGRQQTTVDISQVSGGIQIIIGTYKNGSVSLNRSLFNFSLADRLPQVQVELSMWVTFLLLTATLILEIITGMLTFLYFYFRNEPEIKATSPYLNLLSFTGIYMVLTGIELLLLTLSGRKEYVSVPLCMSTLWFLNVGDALYFITLLVRIIRTYHIFTYFGRTGRMWSDIVLVMVILGLVSVVIVNHVLWTATDMPIVNTNKRVYDEKVFVEKYCDYQKTIWFTLHVVYSGVIRLLLVIFSVLTRNIRRQHFKDTKKVNLFVYMNIPFGALLLASPVITTDRTLRAILYYVSLTGLVILYIMLLIAPKVWPPCIRKLCNKPKRITKSHILYQMPSSVTDT